MDKDAQSLFGHLDKRNVDDDDDDDERDDFDDEDKEADTAAKGEKSHFN